MKKIFFILLSFMSCYAMFPERKSKTVRLKISLADDYCSIIEVSAEKRCRPNDNILLEIQKNNAPLQLLNIEIPEIDTVMKRSFDVHDFNSYNVKEKN